MGPVQPLGDFSTIIGQRGRVASRAGARAVLDRAGCRSMAVVQRGRHELVHVVAGPRPSTKCGSQPQPRRNCVQLVVPDAGQDGRVADLVAVEVQDRQHRAVADRVEELGGLPGGGQRPGLGLAVADDAGDDQAGIVERGPERVAEGVAELAALVDRPGRGGRDVAGDTAGERELGEQLLQPRLVLADVRVDLAVGALQVGVADQRRAAVTRAGDVEHVQVEFLDDPVQVDVDEVLPRRRAPVPDHQRLHVRQLQRPFQQRVVVEVELADRQVVGGPPVRIHPAQQLGGERAGRCGYREENIRCRENVCHGIL